MRDFSLEIFNIENDRRILDFCTYDDVPIWMIGRWYLLHDVVGGKLMNYSSPESFRRVNKKMFSSVIKTICHNFFVSNSKRGASIYLYSTNRKTIVNGKFYNRYIDPLYILFQEKSFVIEQALIDWEWPYPRTSEKVIFDSIARLIGEIKGRTVKNHDYDETMKMLLFFNERLFSSTGIKLSNQELDDASRYIAKLIIVMRNQAAWVKKQLTNETKVVISVGAGFPYYYFLNRMLKEKNVVSVELQHGYITKNNIMYNYANEIVSDNRVVEGLPNYMLTYGSWWNDQMNIPVNKISIGNPYHSICVKNIHHVPEENREIVVIGIGENTLDYIRLTEHIRLKFGQFNVKFRPHPGEMDAALSCVVDEYKNVRIDKNIDIYETLSQTSIIIGEVSTVLFEAIGIVNRILLWNTDYTKTYLPDHPFESFETIEHLDDLLEKKQKQNYVLQEDIWDDNWENNYKSFIGKII